MRRENKKNSRVTQTPMSESCQAMLVVMADAFNELGYRRATTARIARRCGVQENVLYRVWPSKEAMFAAVIEHIYDRTIEKWRQMLKQTQPEDQAQAILEYEMVHHGENRLYRMVFAGLTETHSPVIRKALRTMYRKFHLYVKHLIETHKQSHVNASLMDADNAAWAMIGVGMVEQIRRELVLGNKKSQGQVLGNIGQLLLNDVSAAPLRQRGKRKCTSS